MDERTRLPHDAVVGAWLDSAVPLLPPLAHRRPGGDRFGAGLGHFGTTVVKQSSRAVARTVLTCLVGIATMAVFVALGLGGAYVTGHVLRPTPPKAHPAPLSTIASFAPPGY